VLLQATTPIQHGQLLVYEYFFPIALPTTNIAQS
jgi:hypothetical protein